MTRRTGLIDNAVDTLRQRITSGQWAVGTRIPPEPALAELLGVGRNTVREAVQSLVHAGLLARRQGSGTYVLSTSELAVTMGRQIADARQRDVVEVRRSLEVEAARLAARRRSATDVTTLERLREQRAVAYAGGDLDEMVSTDLALHLAIGRAARNPVLLSLYESLVDAISENIRFNFERPSLGDAGHDDLVAAIVAGDEETAMTEVETYLSALVGRG
ncbi:FadR/GntR family transcriptional regulator [Cellulomonas sp. NPDC055163]